MVGSPVFEDNSSMPAAADQLRQELERELEPQERLMWSGYPRQGVLLQGQDFFLVPFSLLWGGFAFFWEYSAFQGNEPFFFRLWGIPFVLIGIWFIAGRFFTDSWTRAQTVYGVTGRRILIISGLFRRQTRSLELLGLSEINISEKPDGSGTITFGPNSFSAVPRGWPVSGQYVSPAFEGIPGARDVLQTIRAAQRAASADRA